MNTIFVNLNDYIEDKWPATLPQWSDPDVLDHVWIEPPQLTTSPDEIKLESHLLFEKELVLTLPGVDAFALSLAYGGGDETIIPIEIEFWPTFKIRIIDSPVFVRLSKTLFRAAKRIPSNTPGNPDVFEEDTEVEYVYIALGKTNLILDGEGNIQFELDNEISLPPCMVAETGIVFEVSGLEIYLHHNTPPPGKPAGWRGIYLADTALYLPGDLGGTVGSLQVTDAYIGNGGFSGTVSNNWAPTIPATFFGLQFELQSVALTFIQNAFTESSIAGTALLPFFDEPVDIEIGIDLDGGFAVRLADPDGLYTLTKENILSLQLEGLGFEVDDDVFTVKLSGEITPLFRKAQDLDWPSFTVEELSIDSEGNVRLQGGWLDLRDQYSFDFHSFQVEITKLGFGKTEDGGKWIGFSGGLKLLDGLTAGASVEGLRIIWYDDNVRDPRITFNGIGIEFEIPKVLRFKGAVSYRELEVDGCIVHRFDADINLELLVLALEMDSKLVIGSADCPGEDPYTFFAIYLGVELPAGIPLWATGLALYGLAGLFAMQFEPDKQEDEPWYGVGPTDGWYKRPEIGVTDLANKWGNRKDSLGLGAGITIGTVYDNGFTFAGRMLFVIVFPGPIVLIEGKGNILKRRSELSEEPIFRALVVLDGRAGTFLIGLDAEYKFGKGGQLIEIGGSVEAFFSFSDASLWHLYIGQKEPRENRIRASVLTLFRSESYFMLDAKQLAMGAWSGWGSSWGFGRLGLTLEAWIEGNALLNWKPAYFYGDLWLHGKVLIKIFFFELGLSVDARLAAGVFDPLHIMAQLEVTLHLPWPLPDPSVDFTLEWGPTPETPPLPLPLKEIAIEHFKVTTSWPLPRGELLLPNYDDGEGFLNKSAEEAVETPSNIPVVPLDCRPHITFGRTVHDDAVVGFNPQLVFPDADPQGWERIGDPDKNEGPVRVRYGLKEIALDKHVNNGWELVARKSAELVDSEKIPQQWQLLENPPGVKDLFGSWAPIPQLPEGDVAPGSDPPIANVKLWLWSITPFDYTRHTGRAWDEWFTEHFPNYPCIPIPPEQEFCYDFEEFNEGVQFGAPLGSGVHPNEPKLAFLWSTGQSPPTIVKLSLPVNNKTQALAFVGKTIIGIWLPQIAKQVRVTLVEVASTVTASGTITLTGFNQAGEVLGSVEAPAASQTVMFSSEGLASMIVEFRTKALLEVCYTVGLSDDEVIQREEMAEHLIEEMARWSQEGEVLEPHTTYRLKVVTTIQAEGERELDDYSETREQTEYAYFRTEGPPGLVELSTPIGHPNPDDFDSGLEDLQRYVCQTIPATVPVAGQKQPLPRPVYRAYDVGAEFNENYVDLMYRIDRRDLGLYLYDNNNRPVRDAEGRLIVLSNRWGETEELTLTESAEYWIETINASTCATLDTEMIPFNKTLTSAAPEQVLDPDTVYEARFVPLLLHEDFSDYELGTIADGPDDTLGRWQVHDQGSSYGPSRWRIEATEELTSHYIVQTSNITGGGGDLASPVQLGTMLLYGNTPNLPDEHLEQPTNWTDYRFNVYLRSGDNDFMGAVFRYQNQNNYYLFVMTREAKYRRLLRVVMGTYTILAEDDFVYRKDQDYLITIEAIGSSLRVHQDSEPVFSVVDESLENGGIGLYCCANEGTRFSDVWVDDFRQQAPIVYRFKFTTSQFSNFFHHLHSFQDETWVVDLPPGEPADATISELLDAAVSPILNPTNVAQIAIQDAEAKAYEALAEHVLGTSAHQNPPELQVMRLERNGTAFAFLVQSPEPIDWHRTAIEVLRAPRSASVFEVPGAVKLTDVSLGTTQPNEESVSLLLRQATELTGYRLEYRQLPEPLSESGENLILFVDEFEGEAKGLVFQETFGSNALDLYTIVDEGGNFAPSRWDVTDGHIVQTSMIFGGNPFSASPNKPGTLALTGSHTWGNIQLSARLWSGSDDGAIGIVFRYQDNNNFYRFSLGGSSQSYRRLIKKVNGTVSVLWQNDIAYELSHTYELVILAYDNQLLGYLDNVLLFSLIDSDIKAGQVGYYCSGNKDAHFEALAVETLEAKPVLWHSTFADLSELEMINEESNEESNAQGSLIVTGSLVQNLDFQKAGNSPELPKTFALKSANNWQDLKISAWLQPDPDHDISIMFRVSPGISPSGEEEGYSYYCFFQSQKDSYRCLYKKIGDFVTVIWQSSQTFTVNQSYQLTLSAIGNELLAYLDGTLLFSLHDNSLKQGGIAFSTSENREDLPLGSGGSEDELHPKTLPIPSRVEDNRTFTQQSLAPFEEVVVVDYTRRLGRWTIHDETPINMPSVWWTAQSQLLQTANTRGNANAQIAAPGTYAIAGNPAWTNYRLIAQMRSDDDDGIGLICRYSDNDNYYRLSVNKERNKQRLIVKNNGVVSVLWEQDGTFVQSEPFTLTLDAMGSRLVGYMGDVRLFDITDDSHARGQIGVYSYANTGIQIDRVEVRRLPLEAHALLLDRFLAGDANDWEFVDEGTDFAPSNWEIVEGMLRQTSNIHSEPTDSNLLSKPGTQAIAGDPSWSDVVVSAQLLAVEDDDMLGLMFRYVDENHYYCWSMDRERQYRRLVKNVGGTFTLLWQDDFIYELEQIYEFTVVAIGNTLRGYMDGVPVFVVEDRDLPTGRIALHCWAHQDARFSKVRVYPADQVFNNWLLDESFAYLDSTRWTFVDEGDRNGPSQWQVSNGELIQTSNIVGGSNDPSELNKPGTTALAGDKTWTNYRTSVRLRSHDNDGIGLTVRRTDENNFYRLSMDRALSYIRLIKKVSGTTTALWEQPFQYIEGRDYILTLDCIGDRIVGYLDGVKLFSVDDRDLTAGCIGLYCWANDDAHFSEVRVAAPIWVPYYTFGQEKRLPGGTQLQVNASNLNDASPAEPSVIQRFIASFDEHGQLRLSADGTDLRILAPGSTNGHSRHFLPNELYTFVGSAKVLRKADGTGLFITIPTDSPIGSELIDGQYRLKLTYRRDNSVVNASSPVLRQAGSSEPEQLKLDIPWL